METAARAEQLTFLRPSLPTWLAERGVELNRSLSGSGAPDGYELRPLGAETTPQRLRGYLEASAAGPSGAGGCWSSERHSLRAINEADDAGQREAAQGGDPPQPLR